jgi:hypothetical protein
VICGGHRQFSGSNHPNPIHRRSQSRNTCAIRKLDCASLGTVTTATQKPMIGQQAADLPLKLLVSRRRFVNSDQSRLIAYLLDENRVFREHLAKKRVRRA